MEFIKMTVEICLSDIESAIQAVQAGATSLELCSNRLEGGITPSIGFVEECVRLFKDNGTEINVLIRPRPGDFCYTNNEFSHIESDILAVSRAGATGNQRKLIFSAWSLKGYTIMNCVHYYSINEEVELLGSEMIMRHRYCIWSINGGSEGD